MQSHQAHLECTYRHATCPDDEPQHLCADAECGNVLYPRSGLDAAAAAFGYAALRQFLEYATSFDDVWFARRTEIARWWLDKYPPREASD